MAIRDTDYKLKDYTGAINKIPRAWNILDSLGLFETEGVETSTATVDVITESKGLITDVKRNGPRQFVGSENVQSYDLRIPFFTLDGVLRESDINSLRKWGTADESATTESAVERIMLRLRRYQSGLRARAMMDAIKGKAYAPNSTVPQYDYYSHFGQTKKQVAFDLAGSGDPREKQEEVRRHIVDKALDEGGDDMQIVCLASPTFIDNLLKNDVYNTAYLNFQMGMNPLRDRPNGNAAYREFTYANVRYIEVPFSDFGGTSFIDSNEAYFLPMGVEGLFKVFHGRSNTLDEPEGVGQELYMFMERTRREINVESETAILCALTAPELVVHATGAASF